MSDFKGNVSNILPSEILFDRHFFIFGKFPSILSWSRVFLMSDAKFLSNAYPVCICRDDYMSFLLNSVNLVNYFRFFNF